MRRPPKQFCRDCGRDLGRGWAKAPRCADCVPNRAPTDCLCVPEYLLRGGRRVDFEWNPSCTVHAIDPYDIPF